MSSSYVVERDMPEKLFKSEFFRPFARYCERQYHSQLHGLCALKLFQSVVLEITGDHDLKLSLLKKVFVVESRKKRNQPANSRIRLVDSVSIFTAGRVFYITLVFSNVCRVLSQCNTRHYSTWQVELVLESNQLILI